MVFKVVFILIIVLLIIWIISFMFLLKYKISRNSKNDQLNEMFKNDDISVKVYNKYLIKNLKN